MKNYPKHIRNNLLSVIKTMGETPWLYAKDPTRDFSHRRKIPFEKLLTTLIGMGGGNLTKEILDSFHYDLNTATSSAFIQQRDKLLPEAMEFLFRRFTATCKEKKFYRGYRLLAVDGSECQLPKDPHDPETFMPGSSVQPEYNELHIDELYDLRSCTYVDALVHGRRLHGERTGLITMLDRTAIESPTILIADRGYEGYNVFAHLQEKGWYYIIRIKDVQSANGIASSLNLPCDGSFDVQKTLTLTRKQTKAVKKLIREHPYEYRFISTSTPFDYLNLHTAAFYSLAFRFVRFPVSENSYELVATNLPTDLFPLEEIKKLYHMRWGIETSFRHLKYTLGLLNFHSKKTEYIIQEIFAKLIMYNFCEMITSHVVIQNKATKLCHQANFSAAVLICRQFLRYAVSPSSVESRISNYLSPIRPNRSYGRYRSREFQIGFFYRIP